MHRSYARATAAAAKSQHARNLARLGMSDAMWEALEDLHLARLNKERGRRRKMNDRTLGALYKRGLATCVAPPDYCPCGVRTDLCACCGPNVMLWMLTETGKALVRSGRG